MIAFTFPTRTPSAHYFIFDDCFLFTTLVYFVFQLETPGVIRGERGQIFEEKPTFADDGHDLRNHELVYAGQHNRTTSQHT